MIMQITKREWMKSKLPSKYNKLGNDYYMVHPADVKEEVRYKTRFNHTFYICIGEDIKVNMYEVLQ